MKAVRAKMFSLMPSSMKSYGESAVTLRNEVELRMKMNSVRKMLDQNHSETKSHQKIFFWSVWMIIDVMQMSWYDRARGRRKFRVNEEEDGRLIQVPPLIKLWWWFLFFDDGAYMLWWYCSSLRKWSRRRQPWASRLSRKPMTLFR